MKENTNLVDKYFPFNIFHINSRHDQILHLHWHDNFEMLFMVGGEAVFHIGNEAISAVPGDILFVNSKQLHSGYSVNNTYADYYAIVFNKSLLGNQAPDLSHSKYISPFVGGELLFPNKIEQFDPNYPLFKQHVQSTISEFKNKQPGYELAIKSYIYLLVTLVIRYYSTAKQKRHALYDHERFGPLFEYIQQHYADKLTVEDAASLVNLSPHHFCKTFKKVTGSTFVQFVNLYRINEAEQLLRNSSLPITQIAEMVGFSNIHYFDRIFKQMKQYPPSQCRK